MAKCKVCKQDIQSTDLVIESGDIHKNGACDVYYNETKQRITESSEADSVISETQLL